MNATEVDGPAQGLATVDHADDPGEAQPAVPPSPRAELVLAPAQATPSIQEVQKLQHHAALLAKSGLATAKKSVEQIVAIGLLGHELGIPLLASLQGIHLIQGQPSFSANLTASLLARGGVTWECVQNTAEQATVLFHRKGWQDIESSFTMDEARLAQLAGKDIWKKYPADLLWARAFTRGARKIGPDLLAGFGGYTPDELGTADHDENFSPPPARTVTSKAASPPAAPPKQPSASTPQAAEEIPEVVTETIEHVLALNEQLKGDAKRNINTQGLVANVRKLRADGISWADIEARMKRNLEGPLEAAMQAQLGGTID